MFTGIIKELGAVRGLSRAQNSHLLQIESKCVFKDADIGDSVSVNGVCLTVVKKDGGVLSFDCVEETIRKTNLSRLKNKDLVNLEGSLRMGEHLGGHFVLGHIDCVGAISDIGKRTEGALIEVGVPKEFIKFAVRKGSVAIDGASLTIGGVEDNRFRVYLIPHTLEATTLGLKKIGDELNIEFDIIGKYVLNAEGLRGSSGITEGFLKDKGFV